MTPPTPSSGPPSSPTQAEVIQDGQIASKLAEYLDIKDMAVIEVMKKVVEEADETGKIDLRRWITSLQAMEGRMATSMVIDWREIGIKPNTLLLKKTLETRRKMLFVILEKLGKEVGDANSFIDIGEGNIAEEISTIERHIFNPPNPEDDSGDKNPLYKKNDIAILNFATIHEYEKKLSLALHAIDTDSSQEDQKATVERIQRMRARLALIERIDPIQAARYSVEGAGNVAGLGKPIRLLLFAAVTVLAVLSSITVLRKLAKKEKLSPGDALAPAYIAAALVLAGVDITGKSEDDLNLIGRTSIEIKNGRLGEIAKKIGDEDTVIKATNALHDLLNQTGKGEARGKLYALFMAHRSGIEHEVFEEAFGDTYSGLVDVLNNNVITPKDRRDFLSRLYYMNIQKERNLNAALAVFAAPELYVVR